MRKRPTQEEVARIAGTSTAVVSYVVNGGPRPVSPDARRRVLAAIAETGYRPNNVARALANGQTSVFGLIVPDLANPFLAQLTQSLEREFFARGYSLLIGDSEDDPDREAAIVETLLSQQVAGLVWYGVDQPLPLDLVAASELPVVLMNSPAGHRIEPGRGRIVRIDTDERGHARAATDHLLQHGRRRVAHVGGPTGRLNARERARGWADALAAAELEPAGRVAAPFSREGGYAAVEAVLESKCDAIVTSNEWQAVGLLAGLARAGVRVPGDVAVAALNCTSASDYTVPALTGVHLALDRVSAQVADALAPSSTTTSVTTQARLVLRESCGCQPTDTDQEIEL